MSPIKAFVAGVLVTVFIPLVSALIFFKMGWVAVNADASPGWFERRIANMSLDASVERNMPRMENPVLNNDETLKAAVPIYKEQCAGCHGGPQGASDFGKAFYPPAPQFVDRKKPFGDPEPWLFYVIKHGVRLTGMPAFGAENSTHPLLKDEQIWGLVRFLKAMQAMPPVVEQEWRGQPTPAPSVAPSAAPSSGPSASPAGAASGSPSMAPSTAASAGPGDAMASPSAAAPSGKPSTSSSGGPDEEDDDT